jgi:hypothetical protein
MSRNGNGFGLPVDPRIHVRQAAADMQRMLHADVDRVAADAEAQADDERLAADREDERVLTAARRNRV